MANEHAFRGEKIGESPEAGFPSGLGPLVDLVARLLLDADLGAEAADATRGDGGDS